MRRLIARFQKQNPDIYVNYQIGLSGEDGVTASDALRMLNTEILAGDGPDVLMLDGISVDTYTEKGLLMDLTTVLANIQEQRAVRWTDLQEDVPAGGWQYPGSPV